MKPFQIIKKFVPFFLAGNVSGGGYGKENQHGLKLLLWSYRYVTAVALIVKKLLPFLAAGNEGGSGYGKEGQSGQGRQGQQRK
jgi:hypothetical protein